MTRRRPSSTADHQASCTAEGAHAEDAGSTGFDLVLQTRFSRRRVLQAGLSTGALALFGSSGLAACSSAEAPGPASLAFEAVAKSLADRLAVPAGYVATALLRLGDPLAAGIAAYRNDGSEDGESFVQRMGDHHDGMHFFGLGTNGRHDAGVSQRGLLVMNHESVTQHYLHARGATTASGMRSVADEVVKEMHAMGVAVVEVARDAAGAWSARQDSPFNRRITALTEIAMSGPAAGSGYFATAYSPEGVRTRGTANNCANGHTPWGSYLTCEENWSGLFRRAAGDDAQRSAKEVMALKRYGIPQGAAGNFGWATVATAPGDTRFARWNAARTGTSSDGSDDFRHAPNTFGWVVEIDPFTPAATPRKRTAMGRFFHEGAWPAPVVAGRPLVYYMGCDARNEYIYKYVSDAPWDPADAGRGLAAGDKYLDAGKLYAARFAADGSGQWLELKLGSSGIDAGYAYPFADQADVLVHARLAADAAGATRMDRPEWAAVHPRTGEVYFTLTNNNAASRPLAAADAANPRFYNDRKTTGADQKGNPNGHIIRWREAGADHAATAFRWDVYLFGARAASSPANVNLSGLTDDNDLSSPDGLWFSQANPGLLWIQTDDGAYTDVTNCMLLAALPGAVGDGTRKTVTNTDGAASRAVETYVGKPPGAALKRFLVGPKECEITGIAETPDGTALFVNIQHPGEDTVPDYADPASYGSHWPDGAAARPRSATVVITRLDGGRIGA